MRGGPQLEEPRALSARRRDCHVEPLLGPRGVVTGGGHHAADPLTFREVGRFVCSCNVRIDLIQKGFRLARAVGLEQKLGEQRRALRRVKYFATRNRESPLKAFDPLLELTQPGSRHAAIHQRTGEPTGEPESFAYLDHLVCIRQNTLLVTRTVVVDVRAVQKSPGQ